MKMQDAYDSTNKLVARRNLSEHETEQRLLEIYSPNAVKHIIEQAKMYDVITDVERNIAVVCLRDDNFIIIATGMNWNLVR